MLPEGQLAIWQGNTVQIFIQLMQILNEQSCYSIFLYDLQSAIFAVENIRPMLHVDKQNAGGVFVWCNKRSFATYPVESRLSNVRAHINIFWLVDGSTQLHEKVPISVTKYCSNFSRTPRIDVGFGAHIEKVSKFKSILIGNLQKVHTLITRNTPLKLTIIFRILP